MEVSQTKSHNSKSFKDICVKIGPELYLDVINAYTKYDDSLAKDTQVTQRRVGATGRQSSFTQTR